MKSIFFSLLLIPSIVQASPIVEVYSNGQTLQFTVTNNLGEDFYIYTFGISLEQGLASQHGGTTPIDNWISPAGQDINNTGAYAIWSCWTTCSNINRGGSSLQYNNYWINLQLRGIAPGQTFSEFQIQTSFLGPINWFAFGISPNQNHYQGNDNFGTKINPGFEGSVQVEFGNQSGAQQTQTIPEPSSLAILFIGCILVRRLRK